MFKITYLYKEHKATPDTTKRVSHLMELENSRNIHV
jgi:hypothetical protein